MHWHCHCNSFWIGAYCVLERSSSYIYFDLIVICSEFPSENILLLRHHLSMINPLKVAANSSTFLAQTLVGDLFEEVTWMTYFRRSHGTSPTLTLMVRLLCQPIRTRWVVSGYATAVYKHWMDSRYHNRPVYYWLYWF